VRGEADERLQPPPSVPLQVEFQVGNFSSLFDSLFLFIFVFSLSQKQDYEDHISVLIKLFVCHKELKLMLRMSQIKFSFLTGTIKKKRCPAGVLSVFYNAKFGSVAHIQRQAALHDCLPRLLANGDT
jgi:hypothetical protein